MGKRVLSRVSGQAWRSLLEVLVLLKMSASGLPPAWQALALMKAWPSWSTMRQVLRSALAKESVWQLQLR